MTEGSLQLRRYLQARRDGMTMTTAAVFAPMSITEARLTEADMAAGRLDHIINEMPSPTPAPATEAAPVQPAIQRASVNGDGKRATRTSPMDGPASPQPKETKMARRPRTPKSEQVVQVHAPDFSLAVSIYHKDIRPAQSKVGEHSQEMSEAYKAIKKRANIQPRAARLAFQLDNMEESKRDDFLRSFRGLLVQLKIFMPADLVDQAEGKATHSEEVVPTTKTAPKPKLATMQTGVH